MKCRYSEQDIALLVEGDLKESALREIEAHLPGCAECMALADELRESQAVFKGLRQETVSTATLGQVRARVLAEVAGVSSRTSLGRKFERFLYLGARRGYALAGVSLVMFLFVGLWYARRPVVPEVVQNAPLPAPPAVMVPVKEQDSRPIRQKVRRAAISKPALKAPKAPAPVADEPPKQLVVKLLTDDPNIVIYWLVEQNGD
jgi:anti-sigma factor RsiW